MGSHFRYGRTTEERFWNRVVGTHDPDGCWEWVGGHNGLGYGAFVVAGKKLYAHRWSYEQSIGDPGSLMVLHRCDNPPCVNPDHLFVGTQTDNMRDMAAKGRGTSRTHCRRGHPRYGANLYADHTGRTYCRKCMYINQKRYVLRKRSTQQEAAA